MNNTENVNDEVKEPCGPTKDSQLSVENLVLCDDIQRERYFIERYNAVYSAPKHKLHPWDKPEP